MCARQRSEAAGDAQRALKDVAADAKDASRDVQRSVQQGVGDLQDGAEQAIDKVGSPRVASVGQGRTHRSSCQHKVHLRLLCCLVAVHLPALACCPRSWAAAAPGIIPDSNDAEC